MRAMESAVHKTVLSVGLGLKMRRFILWGDRGTCLGGGRGDTWGTISDGRGTERGGSASRPLVRVCMAGFRFRCVSSRANELRRDQSGHIFPVKTTQNETTMAEFNITASSRRFGHFTGDLSKTPMDILKGKSSKNAGFLSQTGRKESRENNLISLEIQRLFGNQNVQRCPTDKEHDVKTGQPQTPDESMALRATRCGGNSGFGSHCSGGRT